MAFNKKDEENYDSSGDGFYLSKDKAVVLQEARVFNESPIHPKKCRLVLARLVYLLYQSESLGTKEATETFFSITKLFQHPDPALRQMVYLVIKELSSSAQDVIMVTSSVTKDMVARGDLIYKPNAIRALVKITDASMIQGIERFIKQSIVDKSPSVSSAAIVSALHLFSLNKEVVKRWVNEVQEAVSSRGLTTQYHALGLLYQIRQHDRMAVIKMIQTFSRSLRSPFAYCMLIRYTAKIIAEEGQSQLGMQLWGLLEQWLGHKSEMVVFEAARCITALPNVTRAQLTRPVSVLQLYLSNHKTTVKFAAIRTLNKIAVAFPDIVATCNLDMEALISDANRSVATFAITTLLKTGNEASVDRLMTQISSFMADISDEFKTIIVDAVRSLCLKFPAKHPQMMTFLSDSLRDEGGYEYKKAIVEAIFDIVQNVPDSKEKALSQLCEFIEDCEYNKLAVRILHLIGTHGPTVQQNPAKYIRFIYNRVILEHATVRAAAVATLARFAVAIESIRPRVRTLLNRCLEDVDDEVRDRAAFYLMVLDGPELQSRFVQDDSVYTWSALERSLVTYISDPLVHDKPFDIQAIPVISKAQDLTELSRPTALENAISVAAQPIPVNGSSSIPASQTMQDPVSVHASTFASVPSLSSLGTIFKSSNPIELTESETEYVVSCTKHVLPEHIVFQFTCTNTLNDSILEQIVVEMKPEVGDEEPALIPEFSIPIDLLAYNTPQNAFVVFRRPHGACPTAYFSNTLKFIVKDCDPNTGEADEVGYEDEYLVEDVELNVGDYVLPSYVTNFEKAWEDTGEANEIVETYSLTAVTSINAAVLTVLEQLGMLACDGTGSNIKDRATMHTLVMSGIYTGGISVLARCRMAYTPSSGVTMELSARSKDLAVSERIANAIN